MDNFFQNMKIADSISRVKLDIGLSYSAPHSQDWLQNEPDLLVIGFEPNPECIESILSKNITKRDPSHGTPLQSYYIGSRFFLFPIALSDVSEPTEMIFYQTTRDVGTSSLYKPNPDLGNFTETRVQVFSLQHFFHLFPWDKFPYIEYIKIDAQGADLDIVKGAGHYLKERVVYITIEAEHCQYEGCQDNNVNNIFNYMKSQDFLLINHPNTTDPTFINQKYIHLKDEIYIRQLG